MLVIEEMQQQQNSYLQMDGEQQQQQNPYLQMVSTLMVDELGRVHEPGASLLLAGVARLHFEAVSCASNW